MDRKILMTPLFTSFLFAALLLSFPSGASESSLDQALALTRQGQGAEALPLWEKLLQENPENPILLTNAGLAAAQSKQWGLALSYLRDAHHLAPDLDQTQQALSYVQLHVPTKEIPHQVEIWESYRRSFLSGFLLRPLLFVAGLLVLLVGLLFLRWIKERRDADENDEPLPRLRPIHLISTGLLVVIGLLALSKLYEGLETRATILPEQVAAHTAPDPEAPSLFDLSMGLEVRVLRKQGDWVQIQYPGGPTGWVKQEALRVSSVSPF